MIITGSSGSAGLENKAVIPIYNYLDYFDNDLKKTIKECQLSESSLRIAEGVGSGTFGKVYKGYLTKEKGDQVVAVKTLKG